MQTTELREYCKRRGWDLVHEYSDHGVSGAKESRPELNRLIADAHKRRSDAVVVWQFDRFARSVSHPPDSFTERVLFARASSIC
jgi:DNA invertase Pin-like site-specific DNA recombinase